MMDNDNEISMHQFWLLQAIFWFSLCLISFVALSPWMENHPSRYIAHALLQSGLGMLLAYPLHLIFGIFWDSSLKLRIIVNILAVVVVAGLWNVFRLAAFVLISGNDKVWSAFGDWYFAGIYVFLCWAALYHGMRYYQLLDTESVQKLEAEAVVSKEKFKRVHAESEAKEAQLKMLRYQLNPHFLFNTLNAINSLIGSNEAERAQKMIIQLSQFLRYSLDNNPEMKITLEREVDALSRYLEIEKTRFGDRLQMNIEVKPECNQALIPSLLLQPLLENSMKHAIAKSEHGGTISLKVDKHDDALFINLRDTGAGVSISGSKIASNGGRGVGLRNTVDRLKAFYGAKFSFNLQSHPKGGLETTIQIPFELEAL